MLEMARSEKDQNQQVRLNLNQITPDNYNKKYSELRTLLIGDRAVLGEKDFDADAVDVAEFMIDEEKLDTVVSTIFRKAQNEHLYCKFYSDLCLTITRLEMLARGKKGINDSEFRKKLLNYCREKFQENFDAAETEAQARANAETSGKKFNLDDFKEKAFKHKHQLNGNMDFVGELYISNMLRDKIAKEIFSMLLQATAYTNDTVEAALRFIEKIGPVLEQKLKGPNGNPKFTLEEYNGVVSEFTAIIDAPEDKISTRIKMLVKNMIENKESGWQKQAKSNVAIKTKSQVEQEEMQKMRQAEEKRREEDRAERRAGGGRGGDRDRDRGYNDNKRNERRDLVKQDSRDTAGGKRNDRGGK